MSRLLNGCFLALAFLLCSLVNGPARATVPAPKPPPEAARVYLNPNTGRFWTMDSFEGSQGDPMTLHKYLYCHANPVNGVDPSGHLNSSETMTVSAVQTRLVAATLFVVGMAIHSANSLYETYKAQAEYEQLALMLGPDVKVANATSIYDLERGNAVPAIPGIDSDGEEGGNHYFLHGSSTAAWRNQVRIKPIGRGEFGEGFYTFRASLSGAIWSGKRAVKTSRRGGFPFVMVLRISNDDYQDVMSNALEVRGNQWQQLVTAFAHNDESGTTGRPLVIGPMSNKAKPPRPIDGPDQYKWEAAGRGIKKLQAVMIVPIFQFGTSH